MEDVLQLEGLTWLDLSYNTDISDAGAGMLARYMRSDECRLTLLSVDGCNITPRGYRELCRSVPACLTIFSIGDTDARDVTRMLQSNTGLQHLSVIFTGGESSQWERFSLENNKTLDDDDDVRAVTSALRDHRTLKEFYLGDIGTLWERSTGGEWRREMWT